MKRYILLIIFLYSLNCFSQIAKYNFTNGLGTDDSGNGFDGTLYGSSINGDSLNIGLNIEDYFSIPASILNGKNEFTLLFRIKFSDFNIIGSYPTNHLFSGDVTDLYGSFAMSYQKDENKWVFVTNSYVCTFSDTSIIPNQWYCVCLTRNISGEIKLYVNGIQNSSTYINSDPLSMTSFLVGQETDCYAGCFVQNQAAYSKFDFIYLYNEALGLDDIVKKCSPEMSNENMIHYNKILITPNPIINNLQIKNSTSITRVDIFSLQGDKLFGQIINNETQINISMDKFSSGIYIVKLYFNNRIKCYKISKQ